MGWSHYFRRLYSLDTLDTRFTSSSHEPISGLTTDHPRDVPRGTSRQSVVSSDSHTSRWQTPEYITYIILIGIAVPLMFNAAYSVSKGK